MMEFTIERDVFLRGVQRAQGIVERKSALPVLSNLLVQAAEKETLRIVATDQELCLVTEYRASVIKPGRLTIPARKLFETLREMQGETVHLVEVDGNTAQMTCNKVVCRLKGLPPEDFPAVLIEPSDYAWSKMSPALIRTMIGRVQFAISTDDTRKYLGGVFLEMQRADGKALVRMVAVDGHRLALAESDMTEVEKKAGQDLSIFEAGIIIPRKGLQEIRKLMEGDEEDIVSLGFKTGTLAVMDDKGTFLSVSLVDGTFPDWRRVIPERDGDDAIMTFERSFVLRCLRRMSVITPECVAMTLSPDLLVLNATDPDVGEIRDEIEAKYEGEEKVVKFNGRYLIDSVEAVPGDLVELRIPNGRDMAVIRHADDDGYMSVIMGLKY